jgi:hypothetical protein
MSNNKEIGVDQFQNSSQVNNVDIELPIVENKPLSYQQETVMDQPIEYVNLNTAQQENQQTFVSFDFDYRQPLSSVSSSEMSPSVCDESNFSMSSKSPSSSSSSKAGSPKSSISISHPMNVLPKRRDSNRISRYQSKSNPKYIK